MWKAIVFGLLVLTVTDIVAEENGTHWIVLPSALIPGEPLPVTISFFNTTSDVEVRVDLLKDGHHLLTTNQQVFERGNPGIITVQVPDGLDYYGRYTLLVRGLSGLYFNEDAQLRYDTGQRPEKFFIFIQTDKAIYKPGQTVRFRAFGVFSNMTIYTGAFNVSIFDSKSNKLKQWINLTNPHYGVIENYMVTDLEPVLGNWYIEVSSQQNSITQTKTFTLEKYVLPKFDVTLDLPPYVLTTDKSLTGKVQAKYTYGKPMTGTVLLTADIDYPSSPWKHHGDEAMVQINFDINGEAGFTVPLDRLVDEVDPYSYVPLLEKLAGYHLVITASVTEGLNNLTRNATDKVKFYSKPYSVEFDRKDSPSYFKPGLPFTAYVTINQADGKPVISTENDVEVISYTKFYDESVKNHRARVLWTKMVSPPPTGVLAVNVTTPLDAVSLHLKVSYKGFTTSWTANRPSWLNLNGTFQLQKISEYAVVGSTVEFEVLSSCFIPEVFYMKNRSDLRNCQLGIILIDVSRGLANMVLADSMVAHTGRAFSPTEEASLIIKFPVSRSMEPYAQLIVFYFADNETWSADSVYFNVNDGALIFKNKVAINFSRSSAEPGDEISLRVSTDPSSLVNVLAVDQSVLLLKKSNDITQKDVIDHLKTDTAPSNYESQHNPKKVLTATDIQLLTNVKGFSWAQPLYKQEECIEMPTSRNFAKGKDNSKVMSFMQESPVMMDSISHGLEPTPELRLLQDVTRVRTDFPETWLWTNVTSGADGNVTIAARVPDTITSWIASAFSVNLLSGLGIAETPAKLETLRSFFVSLNLPYSVIRGEELVLLVHVFNYMSQDLDVVVTLEKSTQFKIIQVDHTGQLQYVFKKVTEQVQVLAGKTQTIFIPMVPVEIGKIDISVKAQSTLAADGVKRQLLVEPEGLREDYNIPTMITAGMTIEYPLQFPETMVKDSQYIRVSAIGDVMGPTLNNLHNLLSLPTGNAEMTMANFAPDVYVANYLNLTGQLDDALREKTVNYMEKGYQRMLTFQRPDGSFSLWGVTDRQGNLWLTAFVAKTLHQAKSYIFVSDQVLLKALDWILSKQNFDGSFVADDGTRSILLEGESSGRYSLTAFVLIALLENSEFTYMVSQQKINNGAARARAYLETHINDIQSSYDLAIVSYALRLSGSSRAETTYSRLDKRATEKDGMKYWIDPRLDRVPEIFPQQNWFDIMIRPKAPEGVIISSYALLYNVYSTHSPTDVLKIVKWLVSQRNEKGGFSSTQETVVALQAMSEYTALTSGPLDLTIDVTLGNFTNRLQVTRQDALVLKTTEVPRTSIPDQNATVILAASGSGTALAQVSVSFHVLQEVFSPLFNLSINITEETLRSLVLETCFRPPSYTGTTVLEITIPSGFTAELSSSKTKRDYVKKTEVKDRLVVLYYDELPLSVPTSGIQQGQIPLQVKQTRIQQQMPLKSFVSMQQSPSFVQQDFGQSVVNYKPVCATLEMVRTELVAKSRPALVKLFEYNNPENRALVFYESKLLKQSSFCDICPHCGCGETFGV